MIFGTASLVASPAGVSIGPSWMPMIAPGRNRETIPSAVCCVVVAGS